MRNSILAALAAVAAIALAWSWTTDVEAISPRDITVKQKRDGLPFSHSGHPIYMQVH